jgi:ferritin-like metal-binding protein YciE
MPITNQKELFLMMLSNVRQGAERSLKIHQEIAQIAQDPMIKEALDARVFVAQKSLGVLDECFRVLGEKPVKTSGRVQEVFLEDFKREVAEIQQPEARRLFVLSKLIQLAHLRAGEYVALIAAADMSGHYGVGVLLESCLADKLAFAERTRRFIRRIAEGRVAAKLAA